MESVDADQAAMNASEQISASTEAYTVYELKTATGTVVREYLSLAGSVFAVTWNGPTLPNVRQILGGYFSEYTEAAQKQHGRPRSSAHSPARSGRGIERADAGIFRSRLSSSRLAPRCRRYGYQMRAEGMQGWVSVLFAVIVTVLAGCGGGSSSSGSTPAQTTAVNVQPVTVGQGPGSAVNVLFTSVTVCVPGSSTIARPSTISRSTPAPAVCASWLRNCPRSMVLPQQTDVGGNYAIAECAQFADGYAWGPVKIADVKIAGEEAAALPVQVIGDAAFATIPDNCSSYGPAENDVTTFGANGVLGVGQFLQDCGSVCATYAANGFYYPCPVSGGCLTTSLSDVLGTAQQVANPVARFANDNNGVIIELPPITSDRGRGGEWFAGVRHRHRDQQRSGERASIHDYGGSGYLDHYL